MSTTVELLREGYESIKDPADWWDGKAGNSWRPNCALTALMPTASAYATRRPAVVALARAMDSQRFDAATVVTDFNDSHTHAEVLAAYLAAIANEEARAAEFTADPEPVHA